jgi:hypothetical protein
VNLHPTGVVQRVEAARIKTADEKLEADLEYAIKSQSHLWIGAVVHRVSQQLAESIALRPATTEPHFDAESLSSIEFGCFICEEPLTRAIVRKRCPGEPREH